MGIKNLHQFLRKKCPEAYQEIHLSQLAYKKVAIDVSLFLFKYKSAVGERWIQSFINLILCLRRNHVHCYFVFDGPSPIEKAQEKQKRKDSKQKIDDKANDLEFAIDKYHQDGEIMPILLETMKRRKSPQKVKKLLGAKREKSIDIKWLEKYLERIRGQVVKMTSQDIENAKKLFDLLQIPYITSLSEAETLCAHLSRDDKVFAALSEDTDLLPSGCKMFLHKLNTRNDTCMLLNIDDILNSLEITFQQFQDFCILCGTDYNSNLPKIGPVGAFKLITTHGTLDDFPEEIDRSSLNYVRVREIFSTYAADLPDTQYCGTPDLEALQLFLVKINCRNAFGEIKRTLKPSELTFVDE